MTATITPERLKGLIGAALVQAAILYLLVAGLVVNLPTIGAVKNDLLAFVPPPPPPEIKVETQPKPSHKTEGKAAPPNIESKATEVTAPPVPTPPVPPPPLPAATKPFEGNQSTQGAAPIAGPAPARAGSATAQGAAVPAMATGVAMAKAAKSRRATRAGGSNRRISRNRPGKRVSRAGCRCAISSMSTAASATAG